MSKIPSPKQQTPHLDASKSLLGRLEKYLAARQQKIFWILFGISTIFCLLSFDPRLSGANDDANYIQQGYKYAKNFTGYYYTSQATLFPMFLALPISIFGINVILLKLLTLALNLLSFWLFYKLFKGKVPYTALFATLLVIAINYHFLYYSTHTFNETFFMVLQSLFLILLAKFTQHADKISLPFLKGKEADSGDKLRPWKLALFAGFMAVLLMLAKNAAIGVVMTFILYFVCKRQWKALLVSSSMYALAFGIWILVRSLVWGDVANYGSQTDLLLQKHPYDASKGKIEKVGEFIQRFTDNTQVYLSNRLMETLNLKSDESTPEITRAKKSMGYHPLNENDADENRMPFLVSKSITFLVVVMLLISLVVSFVRKQDVLFLAGVQALVILGLTFLVVHVFWAQHRYLYIFVPILLLLFFNLLFVLGTRLKATGFLLPLFVVWFFITGLSLNDHMIRKQGRVLASAYAGQPGTASGEGPYALKLKLTKALFAGDKYSGITPDWTNYLKLCEWVGKNIPDTALIALRKPGEAFIYSGGREFRGIYQTFVNPDTTLAVFKREHIRFVIDASLRLNQEQNDGNTINTVLRVLQPFDQKFPGMLKLIRKEGTDEPAQLYQVNY